MKITISAVILLTFATAFFPRIIDTFGAPSTINFAHFATVPIAFVLALSTTRTKDRAQIRLILMLAAGLIFLFTVMTASALLNQAGVINVFLDYLLLAEPFMLLLALVCIPASTKSFEQLKNWLYIFAIINLVLAYIQYPLLCAGVLSTNGMGIVDAVQGVFYITGAGNYVSVSVSLCVALHYYVTTKNAPIFLRIGALVAAFGQLILSDSKQILLTFILAWMLLPMLRFVKNPVTALKYLGGAAIFCIVFYWCTQTVEYFSGFLAWARPELYGPNGAATQAKLAGFSIISSYYKSILNWFFGLGPGHTIGRLGGWMIRDYWNILGPLGATSHPASAAVWDEANSNWLNQSGGSTLFSPFFGWVGIWGDLGLLGLGAYLFLAYIVWRYVCLDDLSRFWLLTIALIGCIFTQMEEPGYMLSMAMLFGLRWRELHNQKLKRTEKRQPPVLLSAQAPSISGSWQEIP